MTIIRRNIKSIVGEEFEQSFSILNSDGTPFNFTDLTVSSIFGKTINMVDVLHEVTEEEPSIYQHYVFNTNVNNNVVTISLPNGWKLDEGKYVYVIYYDENDNRELIVQGEFFVTSEKQPFILEIPIDGKILN